MATGQIKLGDFGIAKVLDATKDYAKTMVGTPYYLSPEIIEDRPYDFKSDVWSCGVVLYEMATLKHPFDGDSLVILASKILKDQYPPLDAMYSAELRELVRTMLCKDAKQRPIIREILCNRFLQAASQEANGKYGLGIDLSEFAPVTEEDTLNTSVKEQADDNEYDEEFEDYSASEDEKDELRSSVDKLKIAGEGAFAVSKDTAVDSTHGSQTAGVGGKADSLRSYLMGQMPRENFDRVYGLVRASAEVSPEELQKSTAAVLGAKATELFTLFQLLCFLEDVATGSREG
jgi:serine/threonine protein kinase